MEHKRTQQNTTEHNRTQQNTTEHNRTQQNTTEHNRTQQNTTEHNRTQQNTTEHNRAQQTSSTINKTALIYNKDGEIIADPGIRHVYSGVVFKYALEPAGILGHWQCFRS